MSKLAYVRPLEYFSASSYTQFCENPIEFYIQRLGPQDLAPQREPQNQAMAAGIGFDEAVKAVLENRAPVWGCVEIPEREEMIRKSIKLAQSYISVGAMGQVIADMGVLGGCEVEVTGVAPGTDVPLRGFVDLVMNPTWLETCALDWKVYGGGTPMRQRSPNKGYCRRWTTEGLVTGKKERHALCDEPFETWNEKWARQLAIYAWLLNPQDQFIVRRPGAIDQVTYSRGLVTFTQYRGWISVEFQEKLRDGLVSGWETVINERVVDSGLDPEFLRLLA